MKFGEFQDSQVFITGGAGFIGSNLVRTLDNLDSFKKIFVLDAFTYASDIERLRGLSNKVEVIEDNLMNIDFYLSLISKCKFVINFAAETHVDKSILNGTPFIDSNIVGSFRLFEVCRKAKDVSLIHISTDEVYGSQVAGEFSETDRLLPASIYSATKACADLLALANVRTHNQKIVITRCTNNFGPFQNSEKFIPTVINNALQEKSIPIYGDGANIREWIYVNDHNSAIIKILTNYVPGEIYNIGSGHRISNIELAKIILDYLKISNELIVYVEDRPGHDFRYALTSNKIRAELRWLPQRNFSEALKSTIDWYKSWFEAKGKVYT